MPGRKKRPYFNFQHWLRTAVTAAAAVMLAAVTALAAAQGSAAASPVTTAHSAAGTAAARGNGLTTEAQALRQARQAGKPVPVTAATTPSSTLTADPDGKLTLTQASEPVRKMVHGQWKTLDAALVRNSDGSVSPAVTTSGLRLSGGGTGPLAVMRDEGAALSLTFPAALPAPVLSGPAATYPGVLPGVDLRVTADDQGGFSEVLIVKDAAAAADPRLRALSFRTATAGGIRLRADAAGNLAAATRGGHVIFSAPAPVMWDSAAAAATIPTAANPATGQAADRRTGQPAASSASGPGEAARTGKIGVRAAAGALTLIPDLSILSGRNTKYPVYIDPTYAAGSIEQGWTMVNSAFPTTSYWQTGTAGLMQAGDNGWQSPFFTARSFVRESVPSSLYTATIFSSTVYFTEEVAPSCDTSLGNFTVQLWQTGGISSSTTWGSQPAWDTEEASKTFAHGYGSSCPPASEGFDITPLMETAASGQWANVTLGLRAADESDPYGWKQFSHVVTMTTTYDHTPLKPTTLTTSPATSCSASTPTTVGNGDVILYAGVHDPDGGSLSVTFGSFNTTTKATLVDATVAATAGTTAALRIKQAALDAAAGSTITGFSWNVTVSDGTLSSPASATCNFKFDPSSPGEPSITGCEGTTGTIGTQISFPVTPNPSGVTPDSYEVQLNGAAPATVTAPSGNATVTVTPTRGTDALTVTALSAGGNVGDSATCVFNAIAPASAADDDLTGDGIPDLLTPGGAGTGLPSGLWLAKGQAGSGLTAGDGQIIPTGLDIGIEGNGFAGDYSPSDFTGAKAITGLFSDDGLQDTLIYYPPGSGAYAGQAAILYGNGDGSVLENEDAGNTQAIPASVFTQADANSDSPLQIANGYNADPGDNPAYPDLIAVNGDPAIGYYLDYYQNAGAIGSYINAIPLLSATTPDGTMDWNTWTITTMAGDNGAAGMFLYQASTGALWLWQDLTINDSDSTAAYTAYHLSSSWNPGTLSELRAADITGTGPALWAVTTAGTATSWTVTGLPSAPAITQDASQPLTSPGHAWRLGDGTSGEAATAADTGSASALSLTGNAGTTWDTSDLFNPAVQFDGSTGYMSTSTQAVNTTSSYTISAWVKPAALGGIILSQYGTEASCIRLSIATTTNGGVTTGSWRFGTTNSDSATATSTLATAGTTYPAEPGIWTHLAVSYDSAAGYIRLYVNGIPAASATVPGTWSSGCSTFTLGRWMSAGGILGGYFNGKIADVQAYTTYFTPTQAATLSGTPGYVLFPSDSHQYGSAATSSTWQWKTAAGEMNFYQGVLTIKETGTGSTAVTFGTSGYPSAVLTLQTDGNLVSYQNPADATAANTGAIWASGTANNSGDLMLYQPDGNLVIYNNYGENLWASNTAN